MKIIVSHSRSKREIAGAFQLCGSRADLLSLATQIIGHVATADAKEEQRGGAVHSGFTFGWLDILPTLPRHAPLIDQPPKGWDD